MSSDRPWEDFQAAAPPADRPWEEFQAPVTTPVAPAAPQVGYTEDIVKGAAGGLGRGTAGLIGLPGTLGGLVHSGLGKIGVPESTIESGAAVARNLPGLRMFTGPAVPETQQNIERYTGPFYQPKTVPGQYASTIGEFAPAAMLPGGGGLLARGVNTVVPALASETAGQLTEGTAAEPYARAAAALAAGPLAARAITPFPAASPARQAAVGVLEGEGIPVTAGQRTGSKPLQWMEASAADMPGSARAAAELNAKQAAAFDRAITERLYDPTQLRTRGVDVNLPDPAAMIAGKQSLSDEYTRLSRANQLRSDPQLQRDLLAAQTKYENLALPSQKSRDVEAVRNSIVDTLLQGQGRMPGDVYQAKRSQLGAIAKGLPGDPYKATAFREMKTALDEAMQRGLSPQDAVAWALTNQRYANMKQLAPAVAAAGENLSPQKVAQTLRAGRSEQYAARAPGSLDELAHAASQVIKPMPQSGTAPRLGMQKLFNVLPQLASSSAAGAAGGSVFGPLGAIGGAAVAPFVMPRLVMSRAGQAYLGNQALPQNARDVIAQAMAQQAIAQPSILARTEQQRAETERLNRRRRLQQGLPE